MTPAETIARARSAIDAPVTYSLQHGSGGSPLDIMPGRVVDGVRYCDCSAFIAWVFGYTKGNYNTDGIIADATGPRKKWKAVTTPLVGGIAVFGGVFRADGTREKPGHVYFLTEVAPMYRLGTLKGIHCSASNPKGRSIQETITSKLSIAVAGGRKWCWAMPA